MFVVICVAFVTCSLIASFRFSLWYLIFGGCLLVYCLLVALFGVYVCLWRVFWCFVIVVFSSGGWWLFCLIWLFVYVVILV